MKNLIIVLLLVSFSLAMAQQDSTKAVIQYPTEKSSLSDKIYYGGGVGF